MSAADELRTAAAVLRENAEGATPGPWGWEPAIPSQLGAQHDAGLTSPSCRRKWSPRPGSLGGRRAKPSRRSSSTQARRSTTATSSPSEHSSTRSGRAR